MAGGLGVSLAYCGAGVGPARRGFPANPGEYRHRLAACGHIAIYHSPAYVFIIAMPL